MVLSPSGGVPHLFLLCFTPELWLKPPNCLSPPKAKMTFKVLPTLRKLKTFKRKRDHQRQTCLRSKVVFQKQLSHVKVLSPITLRYQAEEEFYSEKPLLVFGGQCHCPLPY